MEKKIFFLFTAVPKAYGLSQARGRIGVASEAYATATGTLDASHICKLYLSLWQMMDPYPTE